MAVGAAVGAGQRRMIKPRILIRYLDVAVVVIGVPVAIALGAPAFGWVIGGVAWIAQRILADTDRRFTAKMSDPRRSWPSTCSRPSGGSGCWPARSSSPASSAAAPTASPPRW